MGFGQRLQHAWNAFVNANSQTAWTPELGLGSYNRPDRHLSYPANEKSILMSIYNRIALDVAAIPMIHVRMDEEDHYKETIKSPLNGCLTLQANKDQTGRDLIHEVVLNLCEEGCVALVPTDTDSDPQQGTFEVYSLRCGKIIEWYPDHVKIDLYNEGTGKHEEIILEKDAVAIIENPFYVVMNDANTVLKRLIAKMNLSDTLDNKNGSDKINMIIQLPYVINSENRRKLATQRIKDIEMQLSNSSHGIAYAEATDKIIQLNRSVENNLLPQIQYLTSMLYNQLGIPESVFNGTASEEEMLNYYDRTIEPYLAAISDAIKMKFLTKTARTQGQSIMYFRNPFKLVPAEKLAEISDKLSRNAILSSNEIRALIGYKPVEDPKANELSNKNISQDENAENPSTSTDVQSRKGGETVDAEKV